MYNDNKAIPILIIRWFVQSYRPALFCTISVSVSLSFRHYLISFWSDTQILNHTVVGHNLFSSHPRCHHVRFLLPGCLWAGCMAGALSRWDTTIRLSQRTPCSHGVSKPLYKSQHNVVLCGSEFTDMHPRYAFQNLPRMTCGFFTCHREPLKCSRFVLMKSNARQMSALPRRKVGKYRS